MADETALPTSPLSDSLSPRRGARGGMAAGSGAAAVAALRDEGSPRVDLAVEADPARIEEAIVARHRPDDSELREMDRTIEQMRAWRAEREAWLRSAEVRVTVGVVRTALGPRLLDPRASLPETLAQAAMAAAEGEDGAAAPEAAAEPEEEAPSWVGETTANSAELALEHAVQEFRRSQREADARVPLSEAQRARIDALLRPADDEDEVNALLAAAADDPDLRRRREEAAKLESEIVELTAREIMERRLRELGLDPSDLDGGDGDAGGAALGSDAWDAAEEDDEHDGGGGEVGAGEGAGGGGGGGGGAP